MNSKPLYVGVKAHVAAIDRELGSIVWKTKLKSGAASGDRFVTLLVDGDRVFAHTYGEVYCLDALTGAVLWKNSLEGLSYDLATLAVDGNASSLVPPALVKKQRASSAAAAGAAAGAASASS